MFKMDYIEDVIRVLRENKLFNFPYLFIYTCIYKFKIDLHSLTTKKRQNFHINMKSSEPKVQDMILS